MFIRSERLFLRPFWPEDRAELLALLAEEGADRRQDAGWPLPCRVAQGAEPEDRRCPRFLVTLPGAHGSTIVGVVGLSRAGDAAEAGVWIAPAFRGRGYATEAGRALLSIARSLGFECAMARPDPENDSAARLFTKLGFQHAGDRFVRRFDESCRGDDTCPTRLAA